MPNEIDVTIKGNNKTKPAFQEATKEAEGFKEGIKGLLNPMELLKGTIATLGLTALGEFFAKTVEAAADAEASITRLTSALSNAGITSREAADRVNALADAMQNTTRFDNDALRDVFTTLLGITNDYQASLKNVGLVADLAVAKQMDLNTAAELVGRVMAGNTQMLTRYGIVVAKGADAMEVLRQRFGGFAEKDGKTFQGRIEQTKNAFADMMKEIGFVITGDTALQNATTGITEALGDLGSWIHDNQEPLRNLVDLVLRLGSALAALPGEIRDLPGIGRNSAAQGMWQRFHEWLFHGTALAKYDFAGDQHHGAAEDPLVQYGEIFGNGPGGGAPPTPAAGPDQAAIDKAKKLAEDYAKKEAEVYKKLGGPGTVSLPSQITFGALGAGTSPIGVSGAGISTGSGDPFSGGVMRFGEQYAATMDVAKRAVLSFADTWAQATDAIISGHEKLGGAILKSMSRAIGGTLAAKGKETLLDAAKAAVMGFDNPAEFLKAGKLFAIGTAELAAAAELSSAGGSGGGGGYGGGLTAAGASQSQSAVAGKGTVTVVFKGKKSVIDHQSPDDQDAIRQMIETLAGTRQVQFVFEGDA